jgi:hypothetical protein
MAFEHGITVGHIKDLAPFDTRGAGGELEANVEGYITEAARAVERIYKSIGVSAEGLVDPEREEALTAIKAYALSRMLYKLRHTGETYREAKREWEEFKSTARERPNELSTASVRVYDNFDDTPPSFGEGYEF